MYAMNVSGLLNDYDRAEEACADAETELACNTVIVPPTLSPEITPEPSPSTAATAMVPESEEVVDSIVEQELDEIGEEYDTENDQGEDEEEPPSFFAGISQTSTGDTSSSGSG